jgi:hypothetical protein
MITTPTIDDKGTMTPRLRTALITSTLAIVLAACGTAETADPTPSGVQPTTATESEAPANEAPVASAEPSNQGAEVPSGTLTVADGAAVGGPGTPLDEAIQAALSEPALVKGVLWLEEDGTVWMADEIVDPSVPTFSDVRVQVANYPTDGPTWDMASAELTGLQEINGIRFYEDTQLYGTITP